MEKFYFYFKNSLRIREESTKENQIRVASLCAIKHAYFSPIFLAYKTIFKHFSRISVLRGLFFKPFKKNSPYVPYRI